MPFLVDQLLLDRFFKNQCSEKEAELVLDWLSQPENEGAAKALMSKQWENINDTLNTIQPDLTDVFQNLQEQIKRNEKDFDDVASDQTCLEFSSPKNNLTSSTFIFKKPFWQHNYTGIAAGLGALLVVSLVLFYWLNRTPAYITYRNPAGKIAHFSLPDGSKVWLNASTVLKYPESFRWQQNREVYLEGEGYFDVAEDKEQPFVLSTSGVKVKVLGTAFNVKAFKDDKTIETTLVRGKVNILRTNNPDASAVALNPNQQAVFTAQAQKISIAEVNPTKFISWQNGGLSFEDEPLENVIKALERWYGVEIRINNTNLHCKLTAKIEHESLSQTLELLKSIAGITYTINHNKVMIKGNLCG